MKTPSQIVSEFNAVLTQSDDPEKATLRYMATVTDAEMVALLESPEFAAASAV